MSLWRIPAGVSFADALAAKLLARHADNPLALAEVQILLPTRRACRTLREAFLRQSQGRPLLLPQMLPLGDIDADELALTAGINILPAISSRRRQMLLARLIQKHQADWPLAQCLAMANELARLMDDMTIEGVESSRLSDLVTQEDIAEHWQITLRFLQPVFAAWPVILEAEGCLDGAVRRNRLMQAQVESWRKTPPTTSVIAAGSTGSIPATAALLKAVLDLPKGEVVLPALPDAQNSCDWWDDVDAPHPLYGLKNLLVQLDVSLADVRLWGDDMGDTARLSLLHHALLPSAATGIWATTPAQDDSALVRVDCATEQEEATVIALKLRETLETPGRTAMLVTADRMLGRRVAELLRRWDLAIDDSAGTPLAKSAPATFLRALMDYASGEQDPIFFLALMKHPLTAGGLSLADCRKHIRHLDRDALRGARPAPGIAGFLPRVKDESIYTWLTQLDGILKPLLDSLTPQNVLVPDLLQALVSTAEALATTADENGTNRLWQGSAGESLATWIAELRTASADFPAIPTREANAILLALMSDVAVRPHQSDHPRLAILGPLESRLQSADVVILAGLNENTWPAPPAPDPWLSRPMRKALGLRPAEERIGQEAHDFYTLAAAPEILFTRSLKQGGTPTVPARWLRRLELVAPNLETRGKSLLQWARTMDKPSKLTPIMPPRPTPPCSTRPRELSVTDVEKLLKDPYSIYAKHILKLKPLDELDAEAGVAERGQFIHASLQRLLQEFPEHMPETALERLLTIGEEELEKVGLLNQRAWWWPRFERLATWFVDTQRQRLPYSIPRWLEVKGAVAVTERFTLTARADRIDDVGDGTLAIIDYKTGSLSNKTDRARGFSAQLPLEAAIAKAGGFKDVPAHSVSSLQFWRLTGGATPGEIDDFHKKETPDALADTAIEKLRDLIAYYDNEATPYPSEPHGEMRYSDYRHLARLKEWSVAGEEDSE